VVGVVTVISDAAPTRSQVIVRVAVIDGQRRVEVPGQLLIDLVFISQRKHIGVIIRDGRVVIVLTTRIARRLSRMRPTGAHLTPLVQRLRQGQPGAEPLTLVLEAECSRNVALEVFRDSVHGQPDPDLARFLGPACMYCRRANTDVITQVFIQENPQYFKENLSLQEKRWCANLPHASGDGSPNFPVGHRW